MANEDKPSARFEFPSMLYDMLEEVSDDAKLSKIVSWMPHGRAFKVHKPDEFEANVMPKYFRERYSSFRYLLEQWGFQGLRRGRDRGAYYNALFVRGERYNIVHATKEVMLSVMPEYLAPKDEPDFYDSMPPDPEPPTRSTRSKTSDQRKRTRVEDGDAVAATKTKQGLNRTIKMTETQPSETKALASDNDETDPLATGSSNSTTTTTPSLDVPPLRRPGRNIPRVQYSETQSRPKARQSQSVEEAAAPASNRKVSRKSRGDAKPTSDPVQESTGKDPLPILFRATKPVFSGFGISFEKLRLIVMTANELESYESFTVKRLGSTSKRKQPSH